MGGQQGDALGKVDGGSAADRHQPVAIRVAIDGQRGLDRLFSRIRRGAVEDRRGAGQAFLDPRRQPGRHDSGIGDDQGPRNTECVQFVGQQVNRAEFELYLGQVIDKAHYPLPLPVNSGCWIA
jgi:hypothetical protein